MAFIFKWVDVFNLYICNAEMKLNLKIFLSLIYEFIVLIAIAFAVVFIATVFFEPILSHSWNKIFLQLVIWTAWGMYFILSWYRFNQTLAMKAWKLQFFYKNKKISLLIKRYLLITFFWLFFPINFLTIFSKKKKFLHDFFLDEVSIVSRP